MLFFINIGNTHIQVCRMQGGDPELLSRESTSEVLASGRLRVLEEASVAWRGIVSSVVPGVQKKLESRYGTRLRFLTYRDFPQIDFSRMDTSTLGMDRIANAAGAWEASGRRGAIALDCGTCLVTAAIDVRGRFLGGAIMPGRMLLRRSLADYTAQLPLIDLTSTIPFPLGTKTRDAIAAGVDLGAIGAVQHVIAETRQALKDESCPALVTGGDAPYFLSALPELTPAPSFLTIRGMGASAIAHDAW